MVRELKSVEMTTSSGSTDQRPVFVLLSFDHSSCQFRSVDLMIEDRKGKKGREAKRRHRSDKESTDRSSKARKDLLIIAISP